MTLVSLGSNKGLLNIGFLKTIKYMFKYIMCKFKNFSQMFKIKPDICIRV